MSEAELGLCGWFERSSLEGAGGAGELGIDHDGQCKGQWVVMGGWIVVDGASVYPNTLHIHFTYTKDALPSIGSMTYDPRLARLTLSMLRRSFDVPLLGGARQFQDSSGVLYGVLDSTIRGEASVTLNGSAVAPGYRDQSIVGRAILEETLTGDLFGSRHEVQGVRRRPLTRAPQNAADVAKSAAREDAQVNSRSKAEIMSKDAKMTKGAIVDDMATLLDMNYGEGAEAKGGEGQAGVGRQSGLSRGTGRSAFAEAPPAVKRIAALSRTDPARLRYQPKPSVRKDVLAAALARLKNLGMAYSRSRLRAARNETSDTLGAAVTQLRDRKQGALPRRAAARERVRASTLGMCL